MLAICRDIGLCPQAVMLNYTNPMAMLCQAMQKTTKVNDRPLPQRAGHPTRWRGPVCCRRRDHLR